MSFKPVRKDLNIELNIEQVRRASNKLQIILIFNYLVQSLNLETTNENTSEQNIGTNNARIIFFARTKNGQMSFYEGANCAWQMSTIYHAVIFCPFFARLAENTTKPGKICSNFFLQRNILSFFLATGYTERFSRASSKPFDPLQRSWEKYEMIRIICHKNGAQLAISLLGRFSLLLWNQFIFLIFFVLNWLKRLLIVSVICCIVSGPKALSRGESSGEGAEDCRKPPWLLSV